MRLPQWFKEGLAVMVSGGGGAEGVSELQARDAIRRGDHIAIESSNSLLNLAAIKFVQPPEIPRHLISDPDGLPTGGAFRDLPP